MVRKQFSIFALSLWLRKWFRKLACRRGYLPGVISDCKVSLNMIDKNLGCDFCVECKSGTLNLLPQFLVAICRPHYSSHLCCQMLVLFCGICIYSTWLTVTENKLVECSCFFSYYNSMFDAAKSAGLNYPSSLNETEKYNYIGKLAVHIQRLATTVAQSVYQHASGNVTAPEKCMASNITVMLLLWNMNCCGCIWLGVNLKLWLSKWTDFPQTLSGWQTERNRTKTACHTHGYTLDFFWYVVTGWTLVCWRPKFVDRGSWKIGHTLISNNSTDY